MGFMDKVKAQAEQAVAKAQAGVAQGQAKLESMNATKAHNELLHALGAAYYEQQRSGGSAEAVATALAALDAAAVNGPIDTAAPPTAAPGTVVPPAGTPTGDFTL